MERYAWPGNVRELERHRARVVIAPGNEVTRECLRTGFSDPASVASLARRSQQRIGARHRPRKIFTTKSPVRDRSHSPRLEQTGGHQSRARVVGLNATTLNLKVKTYNINPRS